VGDRFLESLSIQDRTEQACLDFIRTDLDVCLTFAAVAETAYSMGHQEHAEQTVASAEKGYSTLLRFFSKVENPTPETKKELELTLKRLRERLDGLPRRR
jgi:hypothetical protein